MFTKYLYPVRILGGFRYNYANQLVVVANHFPLSILLLTVIILRLISFLGLSHDFLKKLGISSSFNGTSSAEIEMFEGDYLTALLRTGSNNTVEVLANKSKYGKIINTVPSKGGTHNKRTKDRASGIEP